jgi:outer membrane lipoprotein carrier protein
MRIKKISALLVLILSFGVYNLMPQEELIGAKELLQKISNKFKAEVKDFKADIKWIQGNNTQKGEIIFKNPQKVKINFNDPAGQVICSNGYDLWVYISTLNTILHQKIMDRQRIKTDTKGKTDSGKNKNGQNKSKNDQSKSEPPVNPIFLNPVGYDKFLSEYSVEYDETKDKIAYTDGTKVYKFKLIRWRSSKSSFNVIFLTVQENGLARQIEGITASYRKIVYQLDNYKVNNNISELLFDYEPPAHATLIDNFISEQQETEY